MIHVLRAKATLQQISEMLQVHGHFIKVAVDIRQGFLAGGGEFHADCETVLIEDGSRKEDIWGADWVPETNEARFGALINIRAKRNPAMEIQDSVIREQVERIMRMLLEAP